jgi:ribonuclease HI
MDSTMRICANCRVLVEPAAGAWQHVPAFAEKFSRSVCSAPAPGREPSGSETRFGLARIKTPGGDKYVIKGEIPELAVPDGERITVAVDGSYKLTVNRDDKVSKPMSWAYVTTNGLYGMGTSLAPGSVVGDAEKRWLQAELRAIAAALHAVKGPHPITVLSDSKDALSFMTLWRDGYEVWPGGYNPARAGGRESTLGLLARRARQDRDLIQTEYVPGHTGHPLNEAADALAHIARAWATGQLDQHVAAADARTIVRRQLGRHAAAAA